MNREPRAVLLLLGLAVIAHAARLWVGRAGAPPGELLVPGRVDPTGEPDPARHRERSAAAARPLAAGEVVDLNTAPAEEIARLPRIGMSLAKQIVEDRVAGGPFRGLEDLDRVSGIGPTLLRSLAGRVRFGGQGMGGALSESGARLSISGAYAIPPPRSSGGPVDLNSASEADLVALPGIGPVRARAILAYRREAGPFAAVSDLERVPGISRSLVTRLTPFLTVR
ncbi:MAG TPA: ComEA family DNA-binding protein [Gemmatimonadales bacterium]|jgi:competence protein ComEA|nr:ComEA family DNA-binding protein [Gemmatimonadales bacterium]